MKSRSLLSVLGVCGILCNSSYAALSLQNGNFENPPAADNQTDITDWFDFDGGGDPFYLQTWLEEVDTPDAFGFSLALAGSGTNRWAYQGIGTADGASSLQLSFTMGSFEDAGSELRDLGVKWDLYAVTGSFVPGQNIDIEGAGGVTLLDSFSASSLAVGAGGFVTTNLILDMSAGGTNQLFLRVSNFNPPEGVNPNGYLWVDNVSIAAVPEPASTTLLIGLGGVALILFRRHRRRA